ncbi:type VII secretion-associated serine protease mycosin [Mycolicibacterium hippocampi]|uniref:Mycosin-4 n=1 Tax=Mycolicibacterium hippocampi TaxID=659824 RepID=A0A7I9ZLT2_9MYCO|nr:type VII secretion-associated serine protease mycosin [Mycolicibacterium hippocampi]GFH01687.1 mycosin-4 [Mycolicibacterium hippocampi]
MNVATRVCRLLAVVTLTFTTVHAAPTAAAVAPPPLDDSRLPASAPPAPPRPTTQHDDCATAAPVSPASGAPGQLAGSDLSAVWALTRGAGQTVAVIDTGVARHRRLPHLVAGGDYVATADGTADCDGHGTIVAGIIGATADSEQPTAFTGIAPDVTILAIRQSSNKFRAADDPGGSGSGDVETLAAAVRTAADLGATVINISSVACLPADSALDDRALGAALAYAVDVKNVVVVTAAGNVGGPGQCPRANPRDGAGWDEVSVVVSPAWYDDYVLTVGSVDGHGTPSQFSLAGPWVDVAAPGENVVSLAPAGEGLVHTVSDGSPISGTSYAAPVVSAVAALVRARSPELTARQVVQRIEETARRPAAGWNPTVGHGVVDALAAVSVPAPAGPRPQSSTPLTRAMPAPAVDRSAGVTAVRAAAFCVALTGIIAVSVAVGRSRRRDTAFADAVPQD